MLACQNLWKIDKAEKDQLDRFFLLFDNGPQFFKDIEHREDPKFPYESEYFIKLEDDTATWNIRFLKPLTTLKALGDKQVALSFREHKLSNFHWVVVTQWLEREKPIEEMDTEKTDV